MSPGLIVDRILGISPGLSVDRILGTSPRLSIQNIRNIGVIFREY
jgi:hypothetical protein